MQPAYSLVLWGSREDDIWETSFQVARSHWLASVGFSCAVPMQKGHLYACAHLF